MLLRTKKYDLEKLNRPRELTRSAKLFFPGGKVKPRMSLTMRKHKQRMQKKRQEQDRLLRERQHHLNPSKRERIQAQQKLFGLKRRVVDRLLQRKAGNGLGMKRQDTRVLLQAYREIDANKDGGVSYDEFETAVGPKHLDIGLSDDEVHQLCIACDIDGNGDITFEEFLQTLIFADKPETQLMLDRARKRESKFLQDTVSSPIEVKPIKTLQSPVTTSVSPIKTGGVRTSSSLMHVSSLLNKNKLSTSSNTVPLAGARPMTTSPVRTMSPVRLAPLSPTLQRNLSTAGANEKKISRLTNNRSPLESFSTMSRQRQRHMDPSVNFKQKSGRFDSLFYIGPDALDGRNGREQSLEAEKSPQRLAPSARPTTTMPASSRNYSSPIDDRPTTTAVGSRQSAFTALKTESGRISPNQQEDRQANSLEDAPFESKSQAKVVDTTFADADGNMMSSRSIMSRGGSVRSILSSRGKSRQFFVPLKRPHQSLQPHFASAVTINTVDIEPMKTNTGRRFLNSRQSGKSWASSPKLRENDETWHKVGVGKDGTLASTGLFEGEQLRRSPLRFNKNFDEKGKGWQQWETKRLEQSGWEWTHGLKPRGIQKAKQDGIEDRINVINNAQYIPHETQDLLRIKGKSKQKLRYLNHINEMNEYRLKRLGNNVGKGMLHSEISIRQRSGHFSGKDSISLA